MKAKVMKFSVSVLNKERDGLHDYQITNAVNKFCAGRDVVDIKISVVEPRFHNNGGWNNVELWYTILYRENELKQFCFDCESHNCQFNHGGECRFSLVHERKPQITEEYGCIDYDYREGDDNGNE